MLTSQKQRLQSSCILSRVCSTEHSSQGPRESHNQNGELQYKWCGCEKISSYFPWIFPPKTDECTVKCTASF